MTTTIEYSRTDENKQIIHDTCWWTDAHIITISFESDEEDSHTNSDDGIENYPIISDSILPEAEEKKRVNSLAEEESDTTGMTYEQALAARPSDNQTNLSPSAAGTPSIPNFMDGVRYALKWTNSPYAGDDKSDFNPVYPYFDNNCTNSISQAIHESNVPYRTAISTNTKDVNLWAPNLTIGKPTWTWNNADYNYQFMRRNYYNTFNSPWVDIGGLIYVDWGGTDGIKDHAMIVTRADRSFINGQMIFNTYISQKNKQPSQHSIKC